MTYRMKANYYTRQAWIHLGKAREAKFILRYAGVDPFRVAMYQNVVRDQAFFARRAMHCATLYRQIDGRL